MRDLAILAGPYIPATSERIAAMMGIDRLEWNDLGALAGIGAIGRPEILFKRLEDKEIEELRARFSGTQKERAEAREADLAAQFSRTIELKVARILQIKRHPEAEKLYIETVDLGGEQREIVSGLVPHYTEEELAGRNVVIVTNLKPAMLRGVESKGMLLAAQEGKTVEVLFADHAKPGDTVALSGDETAQGAAFQEIDIDTFASIPIVVEDFKVVVGATPLRVGDRQLSTSKVQKGRVK